MSYVAAHGWKRDAAQSVMTRIPVFTMMVIMTTTRTGRMSTIELSVTYVKLSRHSTTQLWFFKFPTWSNAWWPGGWPEKGNINKANRHRHWTRREATGLWNQVCRLLPGRMAQASQGCSMQWDVAKTTTISSCGWGSRRKQRQSWRSNCSNKLDWSWKLYNNNETVHQFPFRFMSVNLKSQIKAS